MSKRKLLIDLGAVGPLADLNADWILQGDARAEEVAISQGVLADMRAREAEKPKEDEK